MTNQPCPDPAVDVESHHTYTLLRATLPSGREVNVTVYHDFDWQPGRVEVNWSALGSTSIADAAAYAALLARAAEEATIIERVGE